jgi:hypothetical protein
MVRDELVSLGSIETVHKSAKLDKQARLARIMVEFTIWCCDVIVSILNTLGWKRG